MGWAKKQGMEKSYKSWALYDESESESEKEEYKNDDYYSVILERILDWINSSACPVSFDDTTIKGIKEYSDKEYFKEFSHNQETTIDNIYNGYRIEKWFRKTKRKTKK
jgi:hypothetical protein